MQTLPVAIILFAHCQLMTFIYSEHFMVKKQSNREHCGYTVEIWNMKIMSGMFE